MKDITDLLEIGRGYYYLKEVPVNLAEGLGCGCSVKLALECVKYPQDSIELSNGREWESSDSILGLRSLNIKKGETVNIRIKNSLDPRLVKHIATRLYSGLTSESFYPNFNRYERYSETE